MIELTRLNGEKFTLNALYILQVQSFPDTTIKLTTGDIIVVKESEAEVIRKTIHFYKKINVLGFRKSLEGQWLVKNRLAFSMLVMMLTIIIIALVAVIIYFKLNDESQKQSIDYIVASSWQTKEITTNTKDNQYVRIQFQIQLDNKKAKEEIEKRDFQVYDIIYNSLTEMNAEDFTSQEKIVKLEETLSNEINEILQDGEVVQIYTIEKIIQ